MRAIVAQPLAGAQAEISFDEDAYPPMPPTEGNRALLASSTGSTATWACAEMGELDPRRSAAPATSASSRPMSTGWSGLGPASDGSHTANETVDVPSIFKQAKRAAILMSRLASERR